MIMTSFLELLKAEIFFLEKILLSYNSTFRNSSYSKYFKKKSFKATYSKNFLFQDFLDFLTRVFRASFCVLMIHIKIFNVYTYI